jgi:hypothetical protein
MGVSLVIPSKCKHLFFLPHKFPQILMKISKIPKILMKMKRKGGELWANGMFIEYEKGRVACF